MEDSKKLECICEVCNRPIGVGDAKTWERMTGNGAVFTRNYHPECFVRMTITGFRTARKTRKTRKVQSDASRAFGLSDDQLDAIKAIPGCTWDGDRE